ncbi:MAG: hypothetical protein HQK66_06740 [Desulfamplus sp.]|nr:hypothetical protein [Desulfamplus sp.]
MQKKVWITSLGNKMAADPDSGIKELFNLAGKYGLAPEGHFWVDDLKKMAWQMPLNSLLKKETGVWVIHAPAGTMESLSVRYGLSLLSLCVQNAKGVGFPIIMVMDKDAPATGENDTKKHGTGEDDTQKHGTGDDDTKKHGAGDDDTKKHGAGENATKPGIQELPTALKGAEIIPMGEKTLGAKLAARANTPVKNIPMEYRMDIHANPGYGIWFELGPQGADIWDGVLAGGLESDVNAHGIGPAGSLPLKTVLEYQMQGLKLQFNDNTFSAWAVKNRIDKNSSYYVRFKDNPGALVFGPLPGDGEEGLFHHLQLC